MVVHPGHGNYSGHARQRANLPSASNLPAVSGAATCAPGLVHRIDKNTSGLLVGRQERTGARPAGQAVLRPYDRAASTCALVWGNFEDGRRDHHGQHRPQPPRPAEDVRLRGRLGRQARRDPLAGAEALRLRDAGRVPARNGPHAPDPRPHVVAGASALQRRTLRRRPHPQRERPSRNTGSSSKTASQ